jgi:acetyltransferase-like isoleucine patch superfamily enzyme
VYIKRLIFLVLKILSTAYAKRRIGSYGKRFTVNFPSYFSAVTFVGDYCHFNGIKIRGGGKCYIGSYFHSGDEILVLTQNHNYSSTTLLPSDNADKFKDVRIGKYVWIGSRVIILPGAILGDGCVVQAGAVVGGLFPDNAIIGGNPAKVLKYRDHELVSRLVSEGKFLE